MKAREVSTNADAKITGLAIVIVQIDLNGAPRQLCM
jgi:hypothetical protein